MNIIVMTNNEEFLQFLDPELCTLVETHEKGGLRTLSLDYKFQDLHEDKQLFRIGNKVWVSGDTNLTDTLYVINTPVEINVYAENSFRNFYFFKSFVRRYSNARKAVGKNRIF